MNKEIMKYVYTRKNCPFCLSSNFSKPIEPNNGILFPLLPVCVDTDLKDDILVDFTIRICNECGLIQLKNVVQPEALYKIFHSDGIGQVWKKHYNQFFKLLQKHDLFGGKILEVGAGQGKLTKKILSNYNGVEVHVMDPQYEGPKGVIIHPTTFSSESVKLLKGKYDSVISSHTLEHFIEFKDYFVNASHVLKEGGLLFTSVPNQEFNFMKGYGNQLNFEHPSVCTNLHWLHLHQKYGFEIVEVSFFIDHSIQIVARKSKNAKAHELDFKGLTQNMVKTYNKSIQERIQKIKSFAKPDKNNLIFGASNFTQPLFLYGLDETIFDCVLDNSPLKWNKRLYGTNLMCRKPEERIDSRFYRIFLNIGQYNIEVAEQIKKINPKVECIFL